MSDLLQDVELRTVDLEGEVPDAVISILGELRTNFLGDEMRAALRAQARESGYELHAAEVASTPVALVGFRPVRTLARGLHLRVDDLVVTRELQGRGIGRRLLEYVESRARDAGVRSVFLDSPPEFVDFYAGHGYAPHTALLMRKRL